MSDCGTVIACKISGFGFLLSEREVTKEKEKNDESFTKNIIYVCGGRWIVHCRFCTEKRRQEKNAAKI
jgi:hypothetical protein